MINSNRAKFAEKKFENFGKNIFFLEPGTIEFWEKLVKWEKNFVFELKPGIKGADTWVKIAFFEKVIADKIAAELKARAWRLRLKSSGFKAPAQSCLLEGYDSKAPATDKGLKG